MKRIFISTTSFAKLSDEPLKLVRDCGLDTTVNDKGRKLTEDEILEALQYCEGVIAGTETYSEKVLKRLPSLKVISRLGVGLDNIDLDCSKKMDIKVFKTHTTPAQAVAELTLGMILDLFRKISFHSSEMKGGSWRKHMGFLLSGKTLGIIGLGTIGKKVVELTRGFGLKCLAYDIRHDMEYAGKHNIEYCTLDRLIERSDIVSVHLDLSGDSRGLIDFNALQKMKSSAILINTSRGEVIDEAGLVKALDDSLIAGAGLDVFQEEPYNGPLVNYNNVITTPHIGSYAREIRMQMELEAAENLVEGLID